MNAIRFDYCTLTKSTYPGGLHMKPHMDNESKLSIIINGRLQESTDSKRIDARAGSLVIKPNNILHENYFGSKPVTILSLSFSNDYPIPEVLKTWTWLDHPYIAYLAQKLIYRLKQVKNDKRLATELELIVKALSLIKQNQTVIPDWLKVYKRVLHNPYEENHRIDHISNNVCLHRVHASREFKKHYSLPPVTYRNYVRLNKMFVSLFSNYKNLAALAYECGFSDQSQMSRIIQKETGLTPKKLKQLALSF